MVTKDEVIANAHEMGKKTAAKVFNPNGFLTYYFLNP